MEVLKHYKLSLTHGSSLKIMQLTDMHTWWPLDGSPIEWTCGAGNTVSLNTPSSPYSTHAEPELIQKIIARVKPDLVILTGDIIDARAYPSDSPPCCWKPCFRAVIAPLVAAGIPWTYCQGNHDHEDSCPYPRDSLLDIFSGEFPLCVSEGATSFNHTLTVGPGDAPSGGDSLRLWIFDTGGNNPDPAIMFDTVSDEAIASFERLSRGDSALDTSGVACGLAFHHIPMAEMAYLPPLVGHEGLFGAALHSGKAPWWVAPLAPLVRLLGLHRVVGASKRPSGLFAALEAAPGVAAAFCGHDHYNDFVVRRGDLFMCYGRVTSHSPPSDWEGNGGPLPFERGARVVGLDWGGGEGGVVETWVEEGGGVCEGSRIRLHPT